MPTKSKSSEKILSGDKTYHIGHEIGRGGFAVVFQAFDVSNGDFVALKKFPLQAINKANIANIEVINSYYFMLILKLINLTMFV